jgi:DNA-binding NtrC family response regulator
VPDSKDPAQEIPTGVQEGARQPGRAGIAWTFTVVRGPDAGQRLILDPELRPHALVGQSPVCELLLHDRWVSRRHLAVDAADRLRITDLDSTNGTFVNGVAIVRAFLRGGEVVRVGETEMVATVGAPPAIAAGVLTPSESTGFGALAGASPQMRALYPRLSQLAQSDVPVIIEGETGTGKEVAAEALHAEGRRAGGPFVVFDCAAAPPSLFEAELFGHERGAFTGATSTRKGMFELAAGGTLFIDEIGDLDLPLQARLLRALDQHEVRRLGGNAWIPVDVRVLAATRRDVDRMVQDGRFRDDLFFRLAVGRIELPPLRDRHGDVMFLASHFWGALGGPGMGPPPEVVQRWSDYGWPGNVRELYNAVVRQLELGDGGPPAPRPVEGTEPVTTDDVIGRVIHEGIPFARARRMVQDTFVRRYVESLLARHGGNVSKAASASGIARRYFQMLRSGRR